MSDAEIPKPQSESSLEGMESLLDFNLKATVGYAKHLPSTEMVGFSSIILKTPEGKPDASIPSDCDAPNRAMLTKLYQLAHAEVDDAVAYERHRPAEPGREARYERVVVVQTGHGFNFTEHYAKQGAWENFRVTFSGRPPHILPGMTVIPPAA